MQKRGQWTFEGIITLVVSALMIVAFVSAGMDYGSQEAFLKLALAKDIALTIDLMYSLPGDAEYVYPNDISDYTVEIKDNTVRVYKTNRRKADTTAGVYGFADTVYSQLDYEISGHSKLKFVKKGKKLEIIGVDDES